MKWVYSDRRLSRLSEKCCWVLRGMNEFPFASTIVELWQKPHGQISPILGTYKQKCVTTSFVIWVNWPIKCYQLCFRESFYLREMVLSISFFICEFIPFGAVSTLSNLSGQSISSKHRGIGCCWDRDCIGLNEVVSDFVGFHLCVCVGRMCAQWVRSV